MMGYEPLHDYADRIVVLSQLAEVVEVQPKDTHDIMYHFEVIHALQTQVLVDGQRLHLQTLSVCVSIWDPAPTDLPGHTRGS